MTSGWEPTAIPSSITDSILLTCPTCGKGFQPRTQRQQHCSRNCQNNSTRSKRRVEHDIDFIGVDGEGINLLHSDGSKSHRYVMLSVGDDTLFRHGRELTHNDIFPFLYECFQRNPTSAFVGFYLAYDFTMWLKSLPDHRAKLLFTEAGKTIRQRKLSGGNTVPFPVYVDDWEIDILGMKRFKLRPHVVKGKNKHPWLYVCDTGSFFQTSFLNVIEPTETKWPTGAPCSQEEFETVKQGKENRADEYADGDLSYVETMRRYNQLENRILSRTCSILNQGFVGAGVRLARDAYYGPGQAIQIWLNDRVREERTLSRKQLTEIIPPWVIDAYRASYYGGWFETPYHGHIPGESYEYDITSAYPHAMRNLPCLCGQWTRGIGSQIPLASPVLVFATVEGHACLGPAPFRNVRGNILRPNGPISGWYVVAELEAAKRACILDTTEIHGWIAYHGCEHFRPLEGMAELFDRRLRIGKTTPTGKAIKLMLNSGYGKFAQSIGTPRYGNPIYASLITSHCRTMILDAIATHPVGADHVLMIATDGLYFRTRHPKLDSEANEHLGGWEPATKHNLTIMKPGVYWDDKARKAIADGRVAPIKSRGISAKSLSENIARIDDEFSRLADDLSRPFPTIDISVPFSVVSPRLALARGKWQTAGRVDWNVNRQDSASLAPKRTHPYLDDGFIRSHPMTVPQGTVSTPYDKSFGYDHFPRDDAWGYTPEGSVIDAIADIGDMST